MDQRSIGADGLPDAVVPSYVEFPCKAGQVVMYDNRIYHNALPNISGRDRCALICSYQPFSGGISRGQSGQVIANAERLHQAGQLDGEDRAMLRQLLGWRLGLAGESITEPALHRAVPGPGNR